MALLAAGDTSVWSPLSSRTVQACRVRNAPAPRVAFVRFDGMLLVSIGHALPTLAVRPGVRDRTRQDAAEHCHLRPTL